jgi:hypothetical protein
MERAASTDERLNLLAQNVDAGFERIEANFDRIDRDIRELRDIIFRFGGRLMIALVGVILALIGLIGAVLATG